MNFADNLKYLRKSKNITQKQLADYLNVSRSTIAGYESCRHRPDFETLVKISEYFQISIHFLLTGSEIASQNTSNINISEAYSRLSLESKHELLKYIALLRLKEN